MEPDELQYLWQQARPFPADQALPPRPADRPSLTRVLGPLRPAKLLGVVVGLAWVVAIDALLYHVWAVASPFFLVSAVVQVLLTKLMIGLYLYQLMLVQRVDVGHSVVAVQRRVARLRTSSLWVVRLGFLQLPAWATFFWTERLLREASPLQLAGLLIPALLFALAAGWLFVHVRYENRHQRWFQLLFRGPEWDPILRAMHLLEQTEDYQREVPAPGRR
ncbi:hypothetical protein EJV47_20645 [Hymenobacter gummosus]|uniref:Uncharacterized protein n=1 Tax=Hymenobacter gummosus TaxID=1776032 RepID=A0A3S0QFM8_9BACT|nr:hypothetical protein [Hymenobacter gummosus]RTQ46786.1 hypothetical protein EJV47_20645 [Hymenobacter gummosus]